MIKYRHVALVLFALSFFSQGCQKNSSDDADGFGQLIVNGTSYEIIEFNCPTTLVDGQDNYCNYTMVYEDNGARWSLIVSFEDSCENVRSSSTSDYDVFLINQSDPQNHYEDEGDIIVFWTSNTLQFSNIELVNVLDENKIVQVSTSDQIMCQP